MASKKLKVNGTTKTTPSFANGAGKSVGALSVRKLRDKLKLTRKSFSRLTGFSERAIADWETDKPLRGPSEQRLIELGRLQQALARIMKYASGAVQGAKHEIGQRSPHSGTGGLDDDLGFQRTANRFGDACFFQYSQHYIANFE